MADLKEAEELKAAGNKHFTQGDFKQAADYYSQSLAKEFALATLTNRSLTYLKLGNNLQAYIDANEATKFHTKCVKALFRRALALMQLGLEIRAMQDLRRCLKIEPQNSKLREQLAIWLLELSKRLCYPCSDELHNFEGPLEEQLHMLNKLEMERDKMTPQRQEQIAKSVAINNKGQDYFNQGNFELSLQFSMTAAALDLTSPFPHLNCACNYLKLENYAKGYFEANEALNLQKLDSSNKELAEIISRVCLTKMGVIPYHPSKWPSHINCSELSIGNVPYRTNAAFEVPIQISARDERQQEIRPTVEYEFFEQFLNHNVSGPLGLFRCLFVTWNDDLYDKVCRVDRERLYSTELFFGNCDFRNLSVHQFNHLFNDVLLSRKKIEFADFQLPAGVCPNDLLKFKAMQEADLLGFCLSPSALNDPNYGVKLEENALLQYLHEPSRKIRKLSVVEKYMKDGFDAFYSQIVKRFKEAKSRKPWVLVVYSQVRPANKCNKVEMYNSITKEILLCSFSNEHTPVPQCSIMISRMTKQQMDENF